MLETDPSFRPVRAGDGYPPLEDLGLIALTATGGQASAGGAPA